MANIFTSSIGKKLIMSLSGFFLMVFLVVHLGANLGLLFGADTYNMICHFMDTSAAVQIMVPVLALGFVIHIAYACYLTLANRRARGTERYAVGNKGKASSWASRNMFALGIIVLGFLGMHLYHFWEKMQWQHLTGGAASDNPYLLVADLFRQPLYVVIYIIWIWALWFHLSHGFWSAFQTIGLNNSKWLPRFKVIALLYATLIAVGFTIIPLFFVFGIDRLPIF